MNRLIVRDERELRVDQAADRLSYLVISFGLLAIVAYRSFARAEAAWDLLGLVVLGGLAGSAYRIQRRVVSRRWALVLGLTATIALALAVIVALATRA